MPLDGRNTEIQEPIRAVACVLRQRARLRGVQPLTVVLFQGPAFSFPLTVLGDQTGRGGGRHLSSYLEDSARLRPLAPRSACGAAPPFSALPVQQLPIPNSSSPDDIPS